MILKIGNPRLFATLSILVLLIAGLLISLSNGVSLVRAEKFDPVFSRTDIFGVSTANTSGYDNPMLFRMDKDGNMIWERPLALVKLGLTSNLLADRNVSEDSFYLNVSTYSYNQVDGKGRIQKFSATGDLVWDLPLSPEVYTVSANPVNGGIYAADYTRGIYRISSAGNIIWGPANFGHLDVRYWTVAADVTDGGALVGVYYMTNPPSGYYACCGGPGAVLKIDNEGNVLWFQSFPYGVNRINFDPVDGGAYVGTTNGFSGYSPNTYKLDATGNIQWLKQNFPSPFTYSRASSAVDGALYIMSGWEGRFAKVAQDGTVQWNIYKDGDLYHRYVDYSMAADITESNVYTTTGYQQLGVHKFSGVDISELWYMNPGYYTYQGGYGPTYQVFVGLPATNSSPEMGKPDEVTVNEGAIAVNTATVSDPDGDSLTLSASVGTITDNGNGTWSWSLATKDGPAESQMVTITAIDGKGGTAQTSFELTVNNVAPVVSSIVAPSPVLMGTSFNASAAFHDNGTFDTHTAVFDWDDGTTSSGTVIESGGSSTAVASHAYTAAGVYTLKVAITDKDGGSGEAVFEYVVVYDPSAGFVTGGGWINSSPGALSADPTLTGKATFGFVSKYQKGAFVPTGQTEFQFKTGALDFHSSSYDWLVIAGPKAQYKGSGTINGGGRYGFMLTAIDGQLAGGGGADKFRIKIWDRDTGNVIYDNLMDSNDTASPTTLLGGGSIVIHK